MDNEKAAAEDNVSGVAEERSCISTVVADAKNNPTADHKVVPCNHEANIDDDNEINGAASLNAAPQPTTRTTTTTSIFQYHRSSMMDALSKVANLSCTTTNMIEIARSFDDSVASFMMMPYNTTTAAADCSYQDGDDDNDDDDEIDGVDKAIPSLQIVPTFTSSFDSIDDEETAALDDDDDSNNNNKGRRMSEDYEEKRYCWTSRRRRIVCWIGIIILVIGCLLGIVMTVLFTQMMKKHESTTGTVMTLDTVFVNSSSQPDLSAAGVPMDIPTGDDGNNQQESLTTTGSSTEVVVSPTTSLTMKPTEESNEPSTAPSNRPSSSSSLQPSTSTHPSISSSTFPSVTPSTSPFALFNYGERLITNYNLGIEISEGLMVRQIAKFGEQVQYVDGNKSNKNFHAWLDGAGAAPLPGGGVGVY